MVTFVFYHISKCQAIRNKLYLCCLFPYFTTLGIKLIIFIKTYF